jgi:Zn-finger nucleic acid-binding protein
VANCCNCAAPLPPHSIDCDYCGSRNDTDLKGVHRYTTHEHDSGRTCPRCNVALQSLDLQLEGKFLIERCEQCLGLFFDPGELEVLLQTTVAHVYTINRKQLANINSTRRSSDYAMAYIKCPVCATVMNRVNFGTRSGVIVDRCPDHGIWLDGGELRQLFEWTKAGGKLLAEERREQQRQEKERAERQKMAMATGGDPREFRGDVGRSDAPELELDLFRILQKVVKFLS